MSGASATQRSREPSCRVRMTAGAARPGGPTWSAMADRSLPHLQVRLGGVEERAKRPVAGLLLHVSQQVRHQPVVRDAIAVEVVDPVAAALAAELDVASI